MLQRISFQRLGEYKERKKKKKTNLKYIGGNLLPKKISLRKYSLLRLGAVECATEETI